MEVGAAQLEQLLDGETSDPVWVEALARGRIALAGNCRCLASMYRAHSEAEDGVVLPALREKLAVPTETYTADHEKEAKMLDDLEALMSDMQQCGSAVQMRPIVQAVRR